MSDFAFPPMKPPTVPIVGGQLFPVRRIFCIGRNYADHVEEMGGDLQKTPPTFFTKPADAVFSGGTIAYPMATDNLHFEAELVVALGGDDVKEKGTNLTPSDAKQKILGFACGCDLTRRDLQDQAKQQKGPWDSAKAFDNGAGVGPITKVADWHRAPDISLQLYQNDQIRQSTTLANMIWPIEDILAKLSTLFRLRAGDLIFTGTPSGVGPMRPEDNIRVEIDGLQPLHFVLESGSC